MPLLAHLREADVRRYVAGAPSLETERHVRVCVGCMTPARGRGAAGGLLGTRGALQPLVKIDPAHEIDELLAQIEEDRRPHAA